jgi:integrase
MIRIGSDRSRPRIGKRRSTSSPLRYQRANASTAKRHTFGTLLNANGENPEVVQELLRHASLKVTTDVYMQAAGPQKRAAQSNLVKLMRNGLVLEIKPA